MILGAVKSFESKETLIPKALRTTNAWDRMRGLLGRPKLNKEHGLWITPCPSVHTIGMRYPIDIIYMDSDGYVKKVVPNLKPMKISSCLGAFCVLELDAGMAERLEIKEDIKLLWEPIAL